MLSSFAQNKIEGIGKFKIGKTTISVTEEIAREMGDKIIIIDEYLSRGRDHFRIDEIVVNETHPHRSPTEASFYPGVRTFHITTYKVAGITINNLILTFKNGILIGLNCVGSFDLAESLALKHGNPMLKTELKKVMCGQALDKNKLELEVAEYTQSWANGKILVSAVITKHYDQECIENLPTRSMFVTNRRTMQLCSITQQ